jgi:hypothetical protein
VLALVPPILGFAPFVAHNIYTYCIKEVIGTKDFRPPGSGAFLQRTSPDGYRTEV